MAILGEIRKRPILLMGIIALALLAFLVNPDTFDQLFGKNPEVLGKVNGDKITREEYNDQLFMLQQQAEQQGQPAVGLEEQAWQTMVQSKLIRQQFDKLGLDLTDDMFWNQLQFDPMFAQNPQNFDEKGNFKLQEIKRQVQDVENSGNMEMINQWLKTKKSIEVRMMARQLFSNISAGITTSKKEAEAAMSQRDKMADIDLVKIDYTSYLAKNPVKVTTKDLQDYIALYPNAFKTEPAVNLGVVYFPAVASAADEQAVSNEINKLLTQGTDVSAGTENFQNTPNDSMFVELNSDLPFNPTYVSPNQLPQSISSWITTASPGQTFGPYKEQNLYVVSKLLDKKASDSVLSKHILIAYQGAERSQATRTKDEAKKIAEDLFAKVKGNAAEFTKGLAMSDEPNAVERNGSVGWVTPTSPFDPAYLNYLMTNPKGATGLVESSFGYHIINIEDKKAGQMGYKVANLVKVVRPSSATEAEVDKNARRFIQQVQGKSFNDFVNIAKKSNLQFSNPKTEQRFDGNIQGAGTAKDGEVIKWAFDKKREKGDTDMFVVDGTGERIITMLNGKQDRGTVDAESVREQIEPVVKNRIAAKNIIAKINASKVSSLDQVSKMFGSPKQTAQVNIINPQLLGAMEPKVAGAAFGVAKGKISHPVEGMTGVYVITKKSETVNKQPGDLKQVMDGITNQHSQQFGQQYLKSLQDNAKIDDYRIEVWDKMGN